MRYNIVYADPPWHFSSKELQKYNGVRFTPLEKHYPTQGKDWIKNLPVREILEQDAALFMWTTDAHIEEAIQTMRSWGFEYVTVAFVWEKVTATGKLVATLGAWNLKNCELCLFGTRGRMLKHKKSNNVYQLIRAERTAHSRKPQEARERICKMFGGLPKIELFAREKVDGWDVWGNEVENSIDILTGPDSDYDAITERVKAMRREGIAPPVIARELGIGVPDVISRLSR